MNLIGSITLVKRLRQNPVWQRHDYGYCWVDLLMLANDEARETFVQGEKIPLQRGQLAWSLRSLEKEWKKSGEWLTRFLSFLTDEGMITVDSNRRRTIITILNYEAYNPAKAVTDTDTETGSKADTETEQKGEVGKGNGKGERASAPPPESFSEIPDYKTIQSFCGDYRDAARGVNHGIGEVWWRGWLANLSRSSRPFPSNWKRALTTAFTADLVARHPKALAALGNGSDSAQPLTGTGENKKNRGPSATAGNGRSPAQARFEISRELEAVSERLDACHEIGSQPDAKDVEREKELKKMLRDLGE